MHFSRLLTFTVLWIVISACDFNLRAFAAWNRMILRHPAHGCCTFCRDGSWFGYVIGGSLLLDITKSPTSRVRGLCLLFSHAICQSCASRRWSWASSNKACNCSMNTAPYRLRISSCCCWPAMKFNGMDGVFLKSHLNRLRSVDECVDVSYAYSISGSMVSS